MDQQPAEKFQKGSRRNDKDVQPRVSRRDAKLAKRIPSSLLHPSSSAPPREKKAGSQTEPLAKLYLESIKLDDYITSVAQPTLNQKKLN